MACVIKVDPKVRAMFTGWQYSRRGSVRVWHMPDLAVDELYTLLDQPRSEPQGELLQPGRNTVNKMNLSGIDVCLKDYGLRHVQPWIYRLRSTKAVRAAQTAQQLHQIGVESPQPLAVIEQRG